VSIDGAREKLAQMDLIAERRASSINLGMPTFSQAAGRSDDHRPIRNQLALIDGPPECLRAGIAQFGEDTADAAWLAQLAECGLLRGSFIRRRTSAGCVT